MTRVWKGVLFRTFDAGHQFVLLQFLYITQYAMSI